MILWTVSIFMRPIFLNIPDGQGTKAAAMDGQVTESSQKAIRSDADAGTESKNITRRI